MIQSKLVREGKEAPIDRAIFWPALITVVVAIMLLVIFEERIKTGLGNVFSFTTHQLGFIYVWFTLFAFFLLLWFALGKYGNVRLGGPDAKPEFSKMSWIAMFFCSGIGTSLLYWATIEWVYYYQWPPFGIEPESQEALIWASSYGIYHWGPLGWVAYTLTALPIGYAFHNRKLPTLRLSTASIGFIGEKMQKYLRKSF